jgi:hypothetical protein
MAEGGSIELLTLVTPLNLSRIFEEPTSAPSIISYKLTMTCPDYLWHHPSNNGIRLISDTFSGLLLPKCFRGLPHIGQEQGAGVVAALPISTPSIGR